MQRPPGGVCSGLTAVNHCSRYPTGLCPVAEEFGLQEGELTVIHSLSAPISSFSTVALEVGVVFPG